MNTLTYILVIIQDISSSDYEDSSIVHLNRRIRLMSFVRTRDGDRSFTIYPNSTNLISAGS